MKTDHLKHVIDNLNMLIKQISFIIILSFSFLDISCAQSSSLSLKESRSLITEIVDWIARPQSEGTLIQVVLNDSLLLQTLNGYINMNHLSVDRGQCDTLNFLHIRNPIKRKNRSTIEVFDDFLYINGNKNGNFTSGTRDALLVSPILKIDKIKMVVFVEGQRSGEGIAVMIDIAGDQKLKVTGIDHFYIN